MPDLGAWPLDDQLHASRRIQIQLRRTLSTGCDYWRAPPSLPHGKPCSTLKWVSQNCQHYQECTQRTLLFTPPSLPESNTFKIHVDFEIPEVSKSQCTINDILKSVQQHMTPFLPAYGRENDGNSGPLISRTHSGLTTNRMSHLLLMSMATWRREQAGTSSRL